MNDAVQQEAAPSVPDATLALGSRPLRNPRHERYALARARFSSRIEAYRQAGFASCDAHTARGNGARLERSSKMQDRIAHLGKQAEEISRAKRAHLEKYMWLVHDANPADLYEVAERPMLNPVTGDPILGPDGEMVMMKYERTKFVSELPEELQHCIESVSVTESGKRIPKLYSKMHASKELRAFNGFGAATREGDDDLARMSDGELAGELKRLAAETGLDVTVTARAGGPSGE